MAATRPWKRQEGSSVRPQRERGPADTVVPTPALQNRESPCFHSSEFVVVCYNDPRVHPVSFPSIPSFLRPFPGVSPLFLHIMFTFVCWLVSAPLSTDAPSTAACVVPSSAPCPEWPWPCLRPAVHVLMVTLLGVVPMSPGQCPPHLFPGVFAVLSGCFGA